MDERLKLALDLCHEPMVALESSIVAYRNTAAESSFPEFVPGHGVGFFLPEQIYLSDAEQFVSSAVINDKPCTVTARRCGRLLLLSIRPVAQPAHGLLSEGLLVSLRTALFNIGLSARHIAAQKEDLTPRSLRYFSALQHNYRLMQRQLLNLSAAMALEDHTLFLRCSCIDLVRFCRELAQSVNGLDYESLAHIEFSTQLPALTANVDTEKLECLLFNLISNSLQACQGEGHTVCLRLATQGSNAVISIDDDGCGIKPEVLQNIFHRYSTAMTPNRYTEPVSAGLGLSVARGLAELHGGILLIESRPGYGTSVRVMFPLQQSEMLLLTDNTCDTYPAPDPLLYLADALPASYYEIEDTNG